MDKSSNNDKPLMMDPVEFWSSQMPPRRLSSGSASQRPPIRSGSRDRDDPLHAASTTQFRIPELNESRQSRIAVVLKSPAYVTRPSWSPAGAENESGNRAAAAATSSSKPTAAASSSSSSKQTAPYPALSAKKETPVPFPQPLIRTSAPTATAKPIQKPVPLPNPLVRTVTPVPAPAPVAAPVVASVAAPTPVPLPKQLIRTPTHSIATASPTTTSVPAPAPASQPSAGRGRPKGWKPGMSYASLRGPAPEKPVKERTGRPGRPPKPKPPHLPVSNPKRRGRPPKAPSPLPWQVYRSLPTSFTAFLCEWSGCKAELHNLDTLRRHVSVVHCKKAPLVCRWGKCAQNPSLDQFPNAPSLRAHIEKEHLIPFSWHIGDGPQNLGVSNQLSKEEEIPDYLKDAQGNQVTPSIRDQEVEDFATWKQNRQKLKHLLVQLNENLPSEDSDSPVYDD